MHNFKRSTFTILLMSALSLAALSARASGVLENKHAFNIPPQPVATALLALAEQAGTQVMTSSVDLKDLMTQGVQGERTVKQALEQILRGTGLKYQAVADNAIAISNTAQQQNKTSDVRQMLAPIRLVQSAPQTAPASTSVERADSDSEAQETEIGLIQVLGSRVRRSDVEGPSPVAVYDREYIYATGALTLADFLNSLPQNYAGISAGRGSSPNELNPEFGQRTESTFPAFNFILGSSAAPPGQTGVSGVSLRGLGSGSTLVLVDGRRVVQSGAGNRSTDSRQGFVDLNTIPLGMVERIEIITDGASALYGADAVAGVINVVLRRDWTGGELNTNFHGSQEGGGRERQASLAYGYKAGKLRGSFSLQGYDRAALKASQRDFTADQDHTDRVAGYNSDGTPIMGRDFRLLWGYPGVVQAVTGDLNGIVGPDGNPTRFAIINPGITGTPTLSDFTGALPGQFGDGRYIVRGNTAEFLDVIPESKRWAASGNTTLPIGDRAESYLSYTYSDTRGMFNTQPAIASAATSSGFGNIRTVVPAALNPFGQDIMVGMVHAGFGSVWQKTHTKAHSAVLGLRGTFGESWQWDTGIGWQRQRFSQITRDFNGAPLTQALETGALNPFIDVRVAPGALDDVYETMAIYPTLDTESELRSLDFNADGEVFRMPGGMARLAVGGFYEENTNDSHAVSYSSGFFGLTTIVEEASGERTSFGMYSELALPLVGSDNARPGMRRLEVQLAARYEDRDEAGTTTVPRIGFSWSPMRSLLLRANYSEGFRAPALTEYQVAGSTFNSNITDPRRDPPQTTGVQVSRGSNPGIKPETSTTEFYGLVFEPDWIRGLNLEVNYYKTEQKDAIQILSAQTIVNNEAFFADRITRAEPTPDDIALGQPGAITAIDQTLINFGRILNESADFVVNYRLPQTRYGSFRLSINASRTLESSRELAPNVEAVDDLGDTFAPPKWRYSAFAFWNRGPWNGSAYLTYLSRFSTNNAGNMLVATYPIASQTNLDLRGGYTFEQGVWGGVAKGLRLNIGIGNVLDEEPAFSDTVFGYNGAVHSPLGRTYEVSLLMPF